MALNPLDRSFLNFTDSFIVAFLSLFRNKKGWSASSLLRYEQLNPKYRVLLLGFPRCQGNLLDHNNDHILLEIIGVSYGTITLLLPDTVL